MSIEEYTVPNGEKFILLDDGSRGGWCDLIRTLFYQRVRLELLKYDLRYTIETLEYVRDKQTEL